MFQFLIGTLQTIDFDTALAACAQVSIPYRYATNAECGTVTHAAEIGFNSL